MQKYCYHYVKSILSAFVLGVLWFLVLIHLEFSFVCGMRTELLFFMLTLTLVKLGWCILEFSIKGRDCRIMLRARRPVPSTVFTIADFCRISYWLCLIMIVSQCFEMDGFYGL